MEFLLYTRYYCYPQFIEKQSDNKLVSATEDTVRPQLFAPRKWGAVLF